jgi:flagellar motor component MotA
MTALTFVAYQVAIAIVALGIWLATGHLVFLVLAGIAAGASLFAVVLEWEQRKIEAAGRRARIDA